MKRQIMKRAHQIRKEASFRFNRHESEFLFSLCLKQAWAEYKAAPANPKHDFLREHGYTVMEETVVDASSMRDESRAHSRRVVVRTKKGMQVDFERTLERLGFYGQTTEQPQQPVHRWI